MPVKIFDDSGHGFGYPAYRHFTADAIRYAVDSGAMVINCSWGSGWSRIEVIAEEIERGVYENPNGFSCLFVFATGNGPRFEFPASMPETFAVGSTDKCDYLSFFSMPGEALNVVAPSSQYLAFADRELSTIDQTGDLGRNPEITGVYWPEEETWPDWTRKSTGTSASTAQVTGIAALILARRPDLISDSMYCMLKCIIEGSAEDQLGDERDTPGWDRYYGHGRVNAYRALLAVIRGDCNNDGLINPVDVVLMVNRVYFGINEMEPDQCVGDCNCDGNINPVDCVFLVNHVYLGGPPPNICFIY